jgi:hypothetical protein
MPAALKQAAPGSASQSGPVSAGECTQNGRPSGGPFLFRRAVELPCAPRFHNYIVDVCRVIRT